MANRTESEKQEDLHSQSTEQAETQHTSNCGDGVTIEDAIRHAGGMGRF